MLFTWSRDILILIGYNVQGVLSKQKRVADLTVNTHNLFGEQQVLKIRPKTVLR